MTTPIAATAAALVSLVLTICAMRLNRLTFRFGWFQPLYKSLLETPSRHLRGLWDRSAWRISDYTVCFIAALPTATLLLHAGLDPAQRGQPLLGAAASLLFTALAECDRRYKCLPPPILIAALAISLLLSTTPYGMVDPSRAIVGAVGAFLFLALPCALYTAITRQVCLGPTDPWLAAMLGAFLGWTASMVAIALGVAVYAIAVMVVSPTLTRNATRPLDGIKSAHPFGLPAALGAAYVIVLQTVAPDLLPLGFPL